MLHHQNPEVPAAQIRVTPEEVTAALNALEQDKASTAHYSESTIPIGQVVQELGLEATPEEIWAQIQRQRAGGRMTSTVVPMSSFPRQVQSRTRRWYWSLAAASALLVAGFAMTTSVHEAVVPATPVPPAPPRVSIAAPAEAVNSERAVVLGSNNITRTYTLSGESFVLNGNHCRITLHGNSEGIVVSGSDNHIDLDKATAIVANGSDNTITWGSGTAPTTVDNGQKNTIEARP